MPSNFIVGIHNTYINGRNYRDRDLTPTHNDEQSLSGSAANFLSFIKKELVPYINKIYPTTGSNTLFGQSHGGTFTMFALLTEPRLFDSYIAADPSFWWDNRYMAKLAMEKLPSLEGMHKTLHICGREGGAYEGMGIVRMDSVLKARAPASLSWKCIAYPDETHNSTKYKSIYDGLKWSYAGYGTDKIELHPMRGIVMKNIPITVYLDNDNNYVHYTTDGTEPTISSPKMGQLTFVPHAGVVKAKAISARISSEVTEVNFTEGNAMPAMEKPKNAKPGGARYSYYEGEWDKLPDFKKLKPVLTGISTDTFNINKLPRQTNFAILYEGYLEIEKDGYYIFGIRSDDGSRLFIGNQLLIDYDGIHGNGKDQTYVLPLQKGFYPIRFEYFRKSGRGIKVVYLTPGATQPMPLPTKLTYTVGK
jgi:hypothetical protein